MVQSNHGASARIGTQAARCGRGVKRNQRMQVVRKLFMEVEQQLVADTIHPRLDDSS